MVSEDSSSFEDGEPDVHACTGPPPDLDEHPHESGPPDDDLEILLADLCRLTAHRPARRGDTESWTRVAITPGLELAARDADRRARSLLERVARRLRSRLGDSFDRR
jgi:hypothetical protein